MLNILIAAEEYFPYKWLPYSLDDKGTLHLRMPPDYSETVAENIKKHIQYTPCDKNKGDALRVPGFLKDLVEAKLQTWVENAFLAIRLQEGREYLVQEKQLLPVDFKSTGIVEMNKKWGDGLQQFLEMKHLTKVSTLSTITNYISNVRYFSMYNGQIYGTTGTLGTESDQEFLQKLYSTLSVCRIPTFNRKKLFEEKGLIRSTKEEWQETICSVVRKKVKSTSYRKGRAALVICEDISKANDLYEVIKNLAESESEKTIKVRQYTRNDGQHGNVSDFDLNPGDVIVATNLAGRGTDIKVSEEVVRSGGLFVVLTFLSDNARVELQAFGRTARKGQPGSAQVIVCSSDIPFILTMDANIDKLKDVRDNRAKRKVKHIMEDEMLEVNLREKLFLKYCSILSGIYKSVANKGREYLVQEKQVLPVDFKSTGIVEMNKKWGDGLQQFLEMKHLTKVSTLSTITNYISNVRYFSMYNGQIYGTTGTLGTESDQEFLKKQYSLSVCRVPTFNRKKLFEEKGLIRSTKEEWQETICSVVRKKVKSTSYRKGRAALVICEDISKANDLYEVIKNLAESESEKTIKVRPYTRNDGQHGKVSNFDLNPGDVIVATNLAGRGTDIKVSEEVVRSGGLFVVLTFLSQNARVELQAFGRTARKGQPGSAQVIVCSSDIPFILTMDANIDKLKDVRDNRAKRKVKHTMEDDMLEVNLREKLFLKYCSILSGKYMSISNKGDKKVTAAIMNEYWGTWLQIKSKDLVQRKEKELEESLEKDTEMAKHKSQSSESPLSSTYHYIKFGNNLLSAGKTEECAKFLEKAMNLDPSWAAITFYNHAYCTLKQRKENYLDASL
ncbi:UNVERIFIED_CONTAM: hypothetical protein FKN15_016825 [Acipenser sinensis]